MDTKVWNLEWKSGLETKSLKRYLNPWELSHLGREHKRNVSGPVSEEP